MPTTRQRDISDSVAEAVTKTVTENVRRVNIDIAEKREPVYTLAEMLSHKKITALRRFGKLCKISGFSRMDKQTILPLLAKSLSDPKILSGHLLALEPHEWEMFRKATQSERVTDDGKLSANYRFLLELGVMALYYHDGHFHYVVPREIQETFREMDEAGFSTEKEHGDLLNVYAVAAANLYGVILQDDFVELFNSQNDRKTDSAEMFGTLLRYVAMESGYCFWKEYIVNDQFADGDFKDVEKLAETAAAKPRYIPAKPAFLRYSKWDYIEDTPALRRLRGFIRTAVSGDADPTENILKKICAYGNYKVEPQQYLDIFKENKVSLGHSRMKELFGLILDLRNSTRLWMNNGHTPDELVPEAHKPVRVVKTGRNELCPCGSGKKYKKCCGR